MKILFLHQGLMSFVRKDLIILQSANKVRDLQYRGLWDIPVLIRCILWTDITFSWFGKLHAFWTVLLSKLLGKKTVVVAGGDDVANVPEIKYGMFSYWWKKWCPLFVFRYADLILSVSQSNHSETIENAKANPTKVKLIYHGFDTQKFKIGEGMSKEYLVITVGGIDWERLYRKGFERFCKSAVYLPEVQFVLIGKCHDNAIEYLRQLATDNVKFTGWVSY